MDKFNFNFDELDHTLNAPKMYKLADVKDQIRKVAFNVVTFRNNPETLWQVVQGDGGEEYIVATYTTEPVDLVSTSSAASKTEKKAWVVETDRLGKKATIFYNNMPITNVDVSKIDDLEDFKYRTPQLLNKNASLVTKMLNSLDESYRRQVLNMFPELQK